MATILVFVALGILPRTVALVALSYGNKFPVVVTGNCNILVLVVINRYHDGWTVCSEKLLWQYSKPYVWYVYS